MENQTAEIGVTTTVQEAPFSEDQLAVMAEWAQQDGLQLADASTSSAEQGEPGIDPFGNALPSTYDLPPPPPGIEPLSIEELRAVQDGMLELGIPAGIAKTLGDEWNRHMAAGPQNPDELRLGAISARQELERRHGTEKANQIIREARSQIDRIARKAPWVFEGLEATAMGNSVWIAETLANLAEARKKL